jgi:adenine-specific DNA-methyltransferase
MEPQEAGPQHWETVAEVGEGAVLYRLWLGENLEAMAKLEHDGGRYQLAYLDPPYNTGRGLRYNDRFSGHDAWVGFMRGRVEAVHRLLDEMGILAVSIDAREFAHLVLLLDDVFGEQNRMANICVKVKAGAGLSVNSIMDVCEYVVVYAKNINHWRNNILRRSEVMERRGEYTRRLTDLDAGELVEETGEISVWRHTGTIEKLSEEALLAGEISGAFCTTNSQGVRRYAGLIPEKGLYRVYDTKNSKTTWFLNKRVVLWLEDRAAYANGKVVREVRETTLWAENWHQGLGAEGGVSFTEGKKPVAMLKRILGWLGKDCTILDPFAGSGSMVQAVAELNAEDGGTRRVDTINNDENSICTSITWPRIEGVISGNLPDGRKTSGLPGKAVLYRRIQ